MRIREQLKTLGLERPDAPSPKGGYVAVVIHGGVW